MYQNVINACSEDLLCITGMILTNYNTIFVHVQKLCMLVVYMYNVYRLDKCQLFAVDLGLGSCFGLVFVDVTVDGNCYKRSKPKDSYCNFKI